MLAVAACGSATPTPDLTAAPSAPAPSAIATSADAWVTELTGTWDGELADPMATYPGRLTLGDCSSDAAPCGGLEYLGPDGSVMCASDLTANGFEDDRLVLVEAMTYQAWNCVPTTLRVSQPDDDEIEVAQYGDGPEPCCEGTFARMADGPIPEPLPALWETPGVGRATSVVALGGTGTQYAAATADTLWMPLANRGRVARIDGATGDAGESAVVGDPGAVDYLRSDPHSVVVADGAVWVAEAAARSIARLDATGAVERTIPVEATPYALAYDGESLWVSSFNDDLVVRVDPVAERVIATFAVPKPTGIAAGAGGLWVVLHRDDAVARIDPVVDAVSTRIVIGPRGPDALCGRCIENVVVADGKVWLSDNHGRAVVRIDPETDAVDGTVSLPHRVWSVTAGRGSSVASQREEDAGLDGRGIVRIDPVTLEVATAEVPVFSVSWGADALWGLGVGRRGDVLYRIEPATGG
jgi:streptogramin lyase